MISVIIPTLNSGDTIQNTLNSIFSNGFPRELFEVIVVDNGSQDRTEEIVRKFPVRFYKCLKRGQGPARNLGIRESKGDIICFTDSDIIVPKGWLKKISDFLETRPDVDGVGGIVLSPIQGHKNNIQRLVGEIYVQHQGFPSNLAKTRYLDYKGSLYSANCAYRKETLEACDGFDESLWNHYYYHDSCDIDLSWRLVKMGKRLMFNPDIKVYHWAPWSLQGIFRQQFGWGVVYTMIKKKYGWQARVFRDKVWPYYDFLSCLLRSLALASFSSLQKGFLRIFYVTSFYLGRIFGYERWKNERTVEELQQEKQTRFSQTKRGK